MKPITGSRVYLKVNRVDPAVVEAARAVTVSDVHESMGSEGRISLMSSRMRPLLQGARIAGPAVTAFCGHGDNLMMHRALYLAQPGDVLVVVCQSELSGAQWGDLAARYALKKGLAGVVVQGCVRDVDVVRDLGFPVWATHISPIHPDKKGHGLVNAPVVCDGVRVCPGDLVVADGDGVQVVPRKLASEVIRAAVEKMTKENAVAEQIDAGGTPWNLHGADKIYAAMDIEEIDAAFDDA
jgi:4-hydroxy-4-methyl-2-oxoglutarate aldolase